jgi:hypothetical protein
MKSTISYGYPYASAGIETALPVIENKSTPMSMSLPLFRLIKVVRAHHRQEHQRERSSHDGHVGDVEGWPVPGTQMEVEVVDNLPSDGSVETVAECAT